MGQEESVQYLIRQLDKVQKPKTVLKVVKDYTRELKRSKKREHENAQVEAAGKVLQEIIRAGGNTLANPYAGTLLVFLGLTTFYPAWFPLFRTALAAIVSDIARAWRDLVIPPPGPTVTLPGIGTGGFCFKVGLAPAASIFQLFTPLPVPIAPVCYPTSELRDTGLKTFKDSIGPLVAFYTFELVNP